MKYNKLIDSLLWLWQLPQNLSGVLYLSFNSGKVITVLENKYSFRVYLMRSNINVSLGNYIFLSQDYMDKTATLQHLISNSIMSAILGPLYFFGMGLAELFNKNI